MDTQDLTRDIRIARACVRGHLQILRYLKDVNPDRSTLNENQEWELQTRCIKEDRGLIHQLMREIERRTNGNAYSA